MGWCWIIGGNRCCWWGPTLTFIFGLACLGTEADNVLANNFRLYSSHTKDSTLGYDSEGGPIHTFGVFHCSDSLLSECVGPKAGAEDCCQPPLQFLIDVRFLRFYSGR